MKLLILTQYYPPEIGAPQNRLHELAIRLKKKGVQVEVLTALPNYPKMEVFEGYRNRQKREETIEGITVHRSWIYVSPSKSIIARLLNMAYKLEKKCYKASTLITGQTQGIVNDIKQRFPEKKVSWLPNGVDISFYDPDKIPDSDFRKVNGFKEEDVIFFYGGILGHAQGLEIIIEAAKGLENTNAQFVIQGAGPEKENLIVLHKKYALKNIHFFEPVAKTEMPGILKSVDIAIVPLKKLDLFKGAIPSKIFEALAMKKPLLLGVDGEARKHFIENAQAGLFYTPEDYVADVFDRNKIAEGLYDELQNM